MAVQVDYNLPLGQDGVVNVPLAPPTAVGGWSVLYTMPRYQGGSGLVTLSCASGYIGVSGLTVLNSGQGIFQIQHDPAQVSGLDPGAYPYLLQRIGSGFVTPLAYGYRTAAY